MNRKALFLLMFSSFVTCQQVDDKAEIRVQHMMTEDCQKTWPHGIVTFEIHESISMREQMLIRDVMKLIEMNTCVRFERRNSEKRLTDHCVVFVRSTESGCPRVGMDPSQADQFVLVRSENLTIKYMVHVLFHVLGRYHEHQRSDRDQYIIIDWDAVYLGSLLEFATEIDETTPQGIPYDYNSVMHYDALMYSWDGISHTILPLSVHVDPDILGKADLPTYYDYLHLKILYCGATKLFTNWQEAKFDTENLTLSWVTEGIITPYSYRLIAECKLEQTSHKYTYLDLVLSSTVTICTLTEFSSVEACNFKLFAVYNRASIDEGISARICLTSETLSNHPLRLRVTAFQPPLITFEWQGMDVSSELGGPITGYQVRFYTDSSYTTDVIDDVSINSYTVQGLDTSKAASYGLSVAGMNAAGVGCHSPVVWANSPPPGMDPVPVNLRTCDDDLRTLEEMDYEVD